MSNLNPLFEFSKLKGIPKSNGVNKFINFFDFLTNWNIRNITNEFLKPPKKYFNIGKIINGRVDGKWITRQQMHEIINNILNDPFKLKTIKNNPEELKRLIYRSISELPGQI